MKVTGWISPESVKFNSIPTVRAKPTFKLVVTYSAKDGITSSIRTYREQEGKTKNKKAYF